MAKNYESKLINEDLTEAEIYAAIRYLDPEPTSVNHQNDDPAFAIDVALVILLLGYLGFLWAYR